MSHSEQYFSHTLSRCSSPFIEEPESKLRWDWRNADWEGYGSAVDQAVRNAQSGRKQPSLDKRVNLLGEFIEAAARTHVGKVRAKAG